MVKKAADGYEIEETIEGVKVTSDKTDDPTLGVRSRFAASLRKEGSDGKKIPRHLRILMTNWAEILLPAAIGVLVWMLFSMK